MITNPVALMFWMSLSCAFAFGVYESIRHALSIHRSRFTSETADEIGRALISVAEAIRGQA